MPQVLSLALLLFLASLLGSCLDNARDTDGRIGAAGSRAIQRDDVEPLVMLGSVTPVVASAAGWLVTPRWTPDGEHLIASGFAGRGLFSVSLVDGSASMLQHAVSAPRTLDFIDGGEAIALPMEDSEQLRRLDIRTGRISPLNPRPTSRERNVRLRDGEGDAVVLWASEAEMVVFEPLRGRVARIADGSEEIVADHGAWGTAVSNDGRRIAYCRGHLLDARLEVQLRGERPRDVGPGVHPVWHDDGRHLLFSAPEVEVSAEGGPELRGSELFLLDVATGREVQLTSTDDVTEMEPAFSPGCRRIAFADWRTGTLYRADLVLDRRGGGGA